MHNIQFIRDNPIEFDNLLSKRGVKSISETILKIDEDRRKSQTSLQKLQEERNSLSEKIGDLKSKNINADEQLKRIEEIKNEISAFKELENIKNDELLTILNRLPNLPANDVPLGIDENSNLEIKKWGKVPVFESSPKQHFEIGENLGLMDFNTATKLSGSRFVILKGIFAKLERAIAQFMIDKHTKQNGYTEISGPLLVKDYCLFGTGQLPKFGSSMQQ